MKNIYRYFTLILIFALSSCWLHVNAQEEEPLYYPTILQIESDEDIDYLEESGVVIWNQRGDMVLALIPMSLFEDNSSGIARKRLPGQKNRIRRARKSVPTMDEAKKHFDAQYIHTGTGLDRAYTGKGVVVGLCDIGLDPNHINFLDADGKTRVKKLVNLNELMGTRTILTTSEEIENWKSDASYQTHGTHVAGIMAGSYSKNGLDGMAPGADIVMASCQLYDAGILAACEEIIDYAKSVNKPAVINLSLGNFNGPHDGTTLFNRYLDLLGEEAIIVTAAGNCGGYDTSAIISFSENNTRWGTRIRNPNYDQFIISGYTDIWSDSSTPFDFRFCIYSERTGAMVYQTPILNSQTEFPIYITSDSDPEFAAYLTGEIEIDAHLEPLNNRWVLEMSYATECTESKSETETWAAYNLSFLIDGEPGQTVSVTSDGSSSWFMRLNGYSSPSPCLSVSDLSTGFNNICVGMYNNRSSLPQVNSSTIDIGVQPLTISWASGYGTLLDGRIFPHTVAPGAYVISSISTDLINNYPEQANYMCVAAQENGKTYYWNYNMGTSMSAPYVAGAIATWLEMCPNLTINDVQKIIVDSNATDCYDANDPKNGLGWFNPYEGLKLAAGYNSTSLGSVEKANLNFIVKGDVLEVFNPSGNILQGNIYSASGLKLISDIYIDSQIQNIDLSSLESGIFIVSLRGDTVPPVSFKFVR